MIHESALIEAILFLEPEPVEMTKLVKISQLSPEAIMKALEELHEKYRQENSGLELSELGGGFSLIPRRDLMESLRHHYGKKTDEKISRAALETLSIIAYSQPLTRMEIESIRGVNCTGTLRLLSERGYIKEVGRKEAPGKPVQYGTTKEFLQLFGLTSISELPKLDEAEKERFELKQP